MKGSIKLLTIKEVCERTGININTFHAWRRDGWRLLPAPVGVAKKTIYFDDSIIERIMFIKAQRVAGKNLLEIQAILEQQAENAPENLHAHGRNESRELIDSVVELERKWEEGDCKNEICLALKLDPIISGSPTTFIGHRPAVTSDLPLVVYISIISNNHVHFAELCVSLGEEPVEVKKHEKMPVEHYGMFVSQIFQRYAENNQFMPTVMIPYLLFSGWDDYCMKAEEMDKFFKEAKKLTKILKAGQEFVQHLNK
jgi:DNA-binding transcriptional MerR regulator